MTVITIGLAAIAFALLTYLPDYVVPVSPSVSEPVHQGGFPRPAPSRHADGLDTGP
jgi:hypothetical protein